MKRCLVELPVWCLVGIVALLITATWLGFVLTGNESGYINGVSSDGSPLFQDWTAYRYDGSFVGHTSNWRTRVTSVYVLQPPTLSGLIAFWWPAGASIAVALLTLVAALMPTSGPLLRKRIRIPRVRITLFRVMVLIGTVSAWLWLSRLDHYTRVVGTLIFGFMLHAGFRRSFLAKEAKVEGADAKVLSRVGIAGYALVLLLALAWVISILVWDSYQEHRL
ncbi:MAG: hypothetical protein ACLQIB_36280 [Isosphaeraceae bacterium]